LQHTLKPTDATRLVWGIGVRKDEIKLPFATNTNASFHSTLHRVFGNLEWRMFNQFTLNLGALFEHNSALAHNDFSPRLALNYRLTDDHGLRFIVSRDSRSPTLAEVHLDTRLTNPVFSDRIIRADDTLLHEKAHYFEFGYYGQFFVRKVTADFKVFRQEFFRLMGIRRTAPAADADGSVLVLGNTAKAVSEGYELQVDFRPLRHSMLRFGYSHVHISTDKPAEGFHVSAPDDSFSILASHTFPGGWRLGSAFYYRTGMEFLGPSDPLGPYKRLDIMAGKTFKLSGKDQVSVAITQQFALDKNQDYTDESVFDNRSFIELTYSHE
ncbi:MAG: TonB-dependent receptor, partial [Pseudomonadota bacterium]